jgi:hypothetical protein
MVEIDRIRQHDKEQLDSWNRLRGMMKDVLAEFGGGEAYLRAERGNFQSIEPEHTQRHPNAVSG